MLKKLFYGSIFISFLSGCNSVPLIKNKVTPVSNISVKYIYSNDVTQSDLAFLNTNETTAAGTDHYVNKGISAGYRSGYISIMKFIRFDNGHNIESTTEYKVKLEIDKNSIVLTPYEMVENQNAILTAYDIPVFTVNELLGIMSSTTHKFDFEVDSKFKSDAVSANFKRLASRSFSNNNWYGNIAENTYFIQLDEADVRVDAKTYPYHDGSKCTVSVQYLTYPNNMNVISLKEIEEKIRKKVIAIVNS